LQFDASLDEGGSTPGPISVDVYASSCDDEAPYTYDDDYATEWSCMIEQWLGATNHNLTFSFSDDVTFDGVSILFGQDTLNYYFSLDYSADGVSWVRLLDNVSSSGTMDEFDDFSFPESTGSFFRITAFGRTGAFPLWNVYREINWTHQGVIFTPDPTCSDGQQNQDETGVDCGGVCISGTESSCTNVADDDSDCLTDCDDPDCSSDPTCITAACPDSICSDGEECSSDCSSETYCADSADNDQDGNTDCDDPDCNGDTSCCGDGVMNGDEDGIDCGGSCLNGDCCTNGYQDANLGETGVDCGGSCTGSCSCAEHDVRSCFIENGYGQQVSLCVDGDYRDWTECSAHACDAGYHIDGAFCVPDSCYDWIVNQNEERVDCGGVCRECGAESLMLPGVPLIHDQTFLIPDDSVVGDTVGDLNLMWVSEGQNMQYAVIDDDSGRFTLNVLSGRDCVSNHLLDYEVRFAVATPNFDYAIQEEHQFTVRATDQDTGEYSDAIITVKLSDSSNTVYINPDCATDEGCCDLGTRACPHPSWRSVTGAWATWACGRNIIVPGTAYLQKRGTVYEYGADGDYYGICTRVTGTPDDHIVFGAYGQGDRPMIDSQYVYGSGLVGGGSAIRFIEDFISYYDIYSLFINKAAVGVMNNNPFGFDHLTFTDLYFNNSYGEGIYLWVQEQDPDNPPTQVDAGRRYAKVSDSFSEFGGVISGGYPDPLPNDNYGFKFSGPARVDVSFSVARFNENHGFSNAAATGVFRYSRSYSNAWGVKAHGNDIVLDHFLIEDNSVLGIHRGSFYTWRGLYSIGFHLADSIIRNNVIGMYVEEDCRDGLIERTTFSDNTDVGVNIRYTNLRDSYPIDYDTDPVENYTYSDNLFMDNRRDIEIGVDSSSVVYIVENISIYGNVFHGTGERSIYIDEVDGLKIYDNLFYANGGSHDIYVGSSNVQSLVVRNNLLDELVDTSLAPGATVDHNMDQDISFFTDPSNFDFSLTPSAPARNSGVLILDYHCPSAGSQEGCDVWYGSAPDIGAYEYVE
jgi:hypothetical protein